MPTSWRVGPYRYFFYAGDSAEPPHTHVQRDESDCKFWLAPVRLAWNRGFSSAELRQIEQQKSMKPGYWRRGISSSTRTADAVIKNLETTDESICVSLSDGRVVTVPISWYPRLSHARPEHRQAWKLVGQGHGIRWSEVDEDISVENILLGQPSGEGSRSFARWKEWYPKRNSP